MALQSRRILGVTGLALGLAAGMAGFRIVWPPPAQSPYAGMDFQEPELPADWDDSLGSAPKFRDVASEAGISFAHWNGWTGKFHYPELMGAGVALFDYDGDGFLDIYFVQGNHLLREHSPDLTNKLYHNRGDGTFQDVTASAGVGRIAYGQGVCVGDYDNDGDSDLYVSNFGANFLYRNAGDGTFAEVGASAGVADPSWGQTCSFLDYDGDGWLDLYVQNYLTYSLSLQFQAFTYVGERKVLDYPAPREFPGAADRLFRNLGDGRFVDVTAAAGILRPDGRGMGCACYDYDGDAFTDLFVSNDSMENYLFRNLGTGAFEEIGLVAGFAFDGVGISEGSMGIDVGDYDGDQLLDMVCPCVWGQVFSVFRNGGEFFSDASLQAGLAGPTAAMTGFSPSFIDHDNDGDLDLFISTGGVRMKETAVVDGSFEERYGLCDLLLANDGKGVYRDVSQQAGEHFRIATAGRGSVVGDLDNDGDLDIVVSNLSGRPAILRNETRGGHWITLKLVPGKGNRDGLGTSVWCEASGRKLRSDVHGGVTYASQNDRRIHFGLGAAEKVDRLEILWTSRQRQVIRDLPADRFYTIREGEEPAR